MSHRHRTPKHFIQHHISDDWLKVKQESAEKDMKEARTNAGAKGLHGSTTATVHETHLPTHKVASTPGTNNEKPRTGRIIENGREYFNKYDDLMERVKKEGWDKEKAGKIHVAVNHHGHAYIHEGNNRAAVAKALGIEHLPVHLEYKNGGERAMGSWHPSHIANEEKKDEEK